MTTETTSSKTELSIDVQRFYVKEQNCKVPHAPSVFREAWKPEIMMELQVKDERLEMTEQERETLKKQFRAQQEQQKASQISDIDSLALYEVTLRLQVTAKVNQQTAYSAEVTQAGIFQLSGFVDEKSVKPLLRGYCATFLYPHAAQVIATMTGVAGFPACLLKPINFDALYQQQIKQQASQQPETPVAPNAKVVLN